MTAPSRRWPDNGLTGIYLSGEVKAITDKIDVSSFASQPEHFNSRGRAKRVSCSRAGEFLLAQLSKDSRYIVCRAHT
jgi:hypothetical protein